MTDELLLDDRARMEAADPAGMLRAVASGAGQVREAVAFATEAGVGRLADEDLPRSVVVLGMGGSGIAGDVLAAVAGPTCPVPVISVRGHVLPTWVGAADLVIAVSYSGSTEETLAALDEAVRRGCRLLAVGATGSPLEQLASRGRALFVPVTGGRQPRASVFALSTPLIVAGDALGLLTCPPDEVEATATLLEQLAIRYQPGAELGLNPAKNLALELSGALPVLWGSSPLASVAAYRFACQLNENAKLPAVWGALPEAGHNQVVPFDGSFARTSAADLFRDREEDPDSARTLMRVVLLRDTVEHPRVERRVELIAGIAAERGLQVSEAMAEGASSFGRLASLFALADWTSVYLALLEGVDPTPVRPIDELKAGLSR